MKGKHKLMTLLGSAVLLGLGAEGVNPSHAQESSGPDKGTQERSKEATCAGMTKEKKQKKKEDKTKKKQKEMVCGGPGACGGKMKPQGGSSS